MSKFRSCQTTVASSMLLLCCVSCWYLSVVWLLDERNKGKGKGKGGPYSEAGLARKYQWYNYINDICHENIMIFSSENIMIFLIFSIFSTYQPFFSLLFTYFLIHAYLTQTAQVPKLLNVAKISTKIFNPLCRVQQRRRRQTQTDGSCHKVNVT